MSQYLLLDGCLERWMTPCSGYNRYERILWFIDCPQDHDGFTLMPIPLTYLEMQLWIGTTTHSDGHRFKFTPPTGASSCGCGSSFTYNGYKITETTWNIIKKLGQKHWEKPLWAVVILIVVMYVLA